jgi:hypothetical protein
MARFAPSVWDGEVAGWLWEEAVACAVEPVVDGTDRAGPDPSCLAVTAFSRSAIRWVQGPARTGLARNAIVEPITSGRNMMPSWRQAP